MNTILTYSGKGGVGKTTVTYCLYKAYKELDKKVVVLDMDLNTPSFHLLCNGEDVISNHEYAGLFLNEAQINTFVRDAVKKIKKLKPEILLIDSPPSITGIHFALIKKLDISGVVLVSQPTELSKSDVLKTIPFFEENGVSVLGVIENMVTKSSLDYGYEKLLSLPMLSNLNSDSVYQENKAELKKLAEKILNMDLKLISLKNHKRMIFDENITWENVKTLFGLHQDIDGDWFFYDKEKSFKDLRFINLSTWKKLHEVYMDMYLRSPFSSWGKDHITEATFDKVERLVKAFEYDDVAQFMITKSVSNVVPLVIGEVGSARLVVNDGFNSVPTIYYKTLSGEVRLFPHEVTPVDQDILHGCEQDGYFYIEEGDRYIPPLNLVEDIAGLYGEDSISSWNKVVENNQPITS